MKGKTNYTRVVPDSHFWTNIEMLIEYINHVPKLEKKDIVKGLRNTLKQGNVFVKFKVWIYSVKI